MTLLMSLFFVFLFCGKATGSHYYSFNDSVTWETAKEKCRNRNMMLAKLDSLDAMTSAISHIEAHDTSPSTDIWIGMYYVIPPSVYQWITEENVTFFQWAPNEPNNQVQDPCIEMDAHGNFRMRTESCIDKNEYLCNDAPMPLVSVDEDFVTTTYYGSVRLLCPYFSVINITDVMWTLSNATATVTITSTTDPAKYLGADLNHADLDINNVQESDVGFYRCHVTNAQGPGIGPPIHVLIVDFPLLVVPDEEYTAIKGDNLTLQCNYYGLPPVTSVEWLIRYPDNTVIIYNGGNSTDFTGSTLDFPSLIIKNVGFQHEALYECKATNDVGSTVSSLISVTIYGVSVELLKENYTVEFGSPVTIACTIESVPSLTAIEWLREVNGTLSLVDTADTVKYAGTDTTNPSLMILRAVFTDGGRYYCRGVNAVTDGISLGGSLLEVTGDLPRITTWQSLVQVHSLHNVTLLCDVLAEPNVKSVFWVKDGSQIFNVTAASPSLSLVSVTGNDDGTYVCAATNAVGSSVSTEIKLQVITEDFCQCSCDYRSKLDYWASQNTTNMTMDELRQALAPILKELRANMTVDVKELTMTKLKYTSAEDSRASAGQIGIAGVGFLVLSFGSLVFMDVMTLYNYLTSLRKRPS